MTSLRGRLATSLLLVAPLLGAVGAPAQATTAPTLSFVDPPNPGLPLAADATDDYDNYPSSLALDIESSQDATVTVTAASDGLTATPATQQVQLTAGRKHATRVDLDDPQPGLHTLTVTLSADGARSVTLTYPYVFTPGAEATPGGDSLAGRIFEHIDLELETESQYTDEDYMLWFVDDTYAYVGPVTRGRPTCTHQGQYDQGCQPYHYDATTGIVEVGDDIVGRVDSTHAFFVGADASEAIGTDDDHPGYAGFRRLGALGPGSRLQGRWSFETGKQFDDLARVDLHLRHDGTYTFRYEPTEDGAYTVRRLHGHYRVLTRGRVRLTYAVGRHGHRTASQVVTLLSVTSPRGTIRPTTRGLWLGIHYRFHKYAYDASTFLRPGR